MYVRVCLEKAVISSRGGASFRCLYRAGELSGHVRTRVAPSPFARSCAARAGPLSSRCVWQAGAAQTMLRWLQAAQDAAGAGPHSEQARAQDGTVSSLNRQFGEVSEFFRRLRRAMHGALRRC